MRRINLTIIISYNPYFQNTASANRWCSLIEGLKKLGVNIKIVITEGFCNEDEIIFYSNYKERLNETRYKYITPKFINGYFIKRFYIYLGNALRYKYLQKSILNEIEDDNDIVWTDSSFIGFRLAVEIKKKKKKQKLFLEQNEFLDIYKFNKGNILQRIMAKMRQIYFERNAFHSYDGLALMTKVLLEHYKQFPIPSPKLLHLPMTVDFERFIGKYDPIPEFEIPYIAYVGIMSDSKDGISILIKSFSKISNEFKNIKLYLVGGWNYDTPFHLKLIKELKLEKRVFWKGPYSRDLIPSILNNATLLALPRPNSKQAQGGFPTKLGEYLATGNPVCATKVGEITNYLVDCESVFFADSDSVDSFAEAMRKALFNTEKAKVIGNKGRNIAEKYFNKDIQAKKLYNFMNEILLSS